MGPQPRAQPNPSHVYSEVSPVAVSVAYSQESVGRSAATEPRSDAWLLQETLARTAEELSEDKRDMVEYVSLPLGNGKEPANPQEEEVPNGSLGTADIQGARNRAKLRRKKLIAGVLFLLGIILSVFLVGFLVRTPSTPGVVSPSSATPLPCPQEWLQNEERCYFFSDIEANWNVSQMNCSSVGGSLVTMETLQEMDFVRHSKNHTYIWIGLWRENVGQPWKRPNGSLFSNWFPIRGQGRCAYLSEEKVSSTWCTNSQFWICSKPALTAQNFQM